MNAAKAKERARRAVAAELSTAEERALHAEGQVDHLHRYATRLEVAAMALLALSCFLGWLVVAG